MASWLMGIRSNLLILALAGVCLGFDLSNSNVPSEEIQDGGVPVDGIPALVNPEFISALEADRFLDLDEGVVGLVQGEEAKAYPIRILNWHEVVNDSFQGTPILVTYCPLAGSARVFKTQVGEKIFQFGVSGQVHKNNLLFYDRETKSLWSQIRGEAVTGFLSGSRLEPLPAHVTTWRAWKNKYPMTQVLSPNTGYPRDYRVNPYADYERSGKPMFPVEKIRSELPAKAWVIGVWINGKPKAYPLEVLRKQRAGVIHDVIQGDKIRLVPIPELDDVEAQDNEGQVLPSIRTYWFVWQAFYPKTELYSERTSYA